MNETNTNTPSVTPMTATGLAETPPRGFAYRPELAIYHPNAKGTGCAIKMNLVPAQSQRDGCIMLSLAMQKSVGDLRAATPLFPTFDWENKITVKLDFNDLCKMLQVFRGECETLEGDKGLFHRSPMAATKIQLRHLLEPITGYSLEVYRNAVDRIQPDRAAHIVLNPNEALGIALAFENSIGLVCFGIPRALESEATAAEPRRAEGVYAA